MSYRNIDELPLGGFVWIEFVPDADGFADEGTTMPSCSQNAGTRCGWEFPARMVSQRRSATKYGQEATKPAPRRKSEARV
jgi:hypothetical protein